MSDADDKPLMVKAQSRRLPPATVALALVLVGLLVAAQGVLAWASWQRERANPVAAGGAPGALVSVLLVNGQVYYGELVEASAAYVRLANVYYVQSVAAQAASQPSNQLVNRSKADWHGPQWMSIPIDKVLFIEGIGAKSRLADLIAEEKKLGESK